MSKARQVVMLEPNGNAKEVISVAGFHCARCNGVGYFIPFPDENGDIKVDDCKICNGSGMLKATVTIEWTPYK